MAKIHKGDPVIVLAGKDRGKRGSVLRVLDDGHVLVDGVNRVKKHQKPNPMRNIQGGIIEKEMPIQNSNVALFNVATQKADRVGYKLLDDGRKVRIYKSSGEMVDAQG
ncbi:MAG: 50S ribosomal protein L24 [Thiobacillaceae bacterium]